MFEGLTCVYRSNVDLFFYVVGSSQENEVSKNKVSGVQNYVDQRSVTFRTRLQTNTLGVN